jgi:hypothetical protein
MRHVEDLTHGSTEWRQRAAESWLSHKKQDSQYYIELRNCFLNASSVTNAVLVVLSNHTDKFVHKADGSVSEI